jgi:hypothetical protein
MREKLLVSIPFHFAPERIGYFKRAALCYLQTYINYNVSLAVDTNSEQGADAILLTLNDFRDKITISIHNSLEHPHHLTWAHRRRFVNEINNYDFFMYAEDDIHVPYESFTNYIHNFSILWPNYIPGFIRLVKKSGTYRVSDFPRETVLRKWQIIRRQNKIFYPLEFPYHGFWIMPQKQLKKAINNEFIKIKGEKESKIILCREWAASFPMWQLKKKAVVELNKDYHVSSNCYSYHLPEKIPGVNDNYGYLKPEEILVNIV